MTSFLAGVLLAASAAQAAPSAVLSPLDAATTLVLVEDHRAPVVEIRLEVPVGLWSPWLREQGGQAAWEGLLLDPRRMLLRQADALGAEIGTSCGTRACTLRLATLRESLPEAVELLRGALERRAFDRRELRRRARARTLEWKLALKDPAFVLRRTAASVLFRADDPRRLAYDRPPGRVPSEAEIAEVLRRMLALPGRAVGVAGDVDRTTAEDLARRLLPAADSTSPSGTAPVLGSPIPLAERHDAAATLPRLTQVYLAEVRTGLPLDHDDAPAFAIADHVLGGHFYSRLYAALRHEGGETYGASTWKSQETVETAYAASTFTRTENAAVTERKLGEVLRKLHADGITADEREAALGYLRGRVPFSRQSGAEVLDRALLERRLGLPRGFLDRLVDRAEGTSLEAVNAFARRFFAPAGFRRVRVGPR